METANWEKLENLFHAALEKPFVERKKYLVQECAGNSRLFTEVEALIDSFEKESYFLEESVLEFGFTAIHETAKDKLKNKRIGSYRIEEKIGEGGMGEVYRAVDTRLNRRVALKFLPESLENDKTAHRQLMREAQASAALDHPNICAVHGFEEIDGYSFIVMQFVEGKTLDEALKDRELSITEFKSIAGQIVSAVAFAHSHNIIHRDLKPGNIMLTSDGQIKILDFGLAKVLQKKSGLTADADGNSQFSQKGLVIGTVAYMSPEQLRGERIDYRSDIFSLGIILCEIITKKNPFKAGSPAEIIASILHDRLPEIGQNQPDLSKKIKNLIVKCLQKEADQRFQSAAEVLVALDQKSFEDDTKDESKVKKRALLPAFTAIVLMLVLFAIFYFLNSNSKRTIAILPITFDNSAIEKKILAGALTQSLIEKLSNLSELEVKNQESVKKYEGKFIEPQTVGKELKVDAVYIGSIVKRNESLYLTAKLVHTKDGRILLSEDILIDETKLIELQETLSVRIVEKIQKSVSEDDRLKLAKRDTESEAAREAYYQGRYLLKINNESDSIEQAIMYFTKAKDLDQKYARAWAGLADAYLIQSTPGVKGATEPEKAVEKARKAAGKALELDNNLSECYNSLGLISLRYDWNWQKAEEYFRKSIDLDRDFLPARLGLINSLKMQQRYDEALIETEKIKEIDPVSIPADLQAALINYRTGNYEEADKILVKLLESEPNNKRIKYVRAYQLIKTNRIAEAIELLEPIYRSTDENDRIQASAPLGFAYAKLGRREEAFKVIESLEKISKPTYVPPQEKALIYVGLGNYEKVFENLKLSCKDRFSALPPWINDPIVDEVKTDPRFEDIKRCANL